MRKLEGTGLFTCLRRPLKSSNGHSRKLLVMRFASRLASRSLMSARLSRTFFPLHNPIWILTLLSSEKYAFKGTIVIPACCDFRKNVSHRKAVPWLFSLSQNAPRSFAAICALPPCAREEGEAFSPRVESIHPHWNACQYGN